MKSKIRDMRSKAESLREEAEDIDWEADALQCEHDNIMARIEDFKTFREKLLNAGTLREYEIIDALIEDQEYDMYELKEIMQRHSFEIP